MIFVSFALETTPSRPHSFAKPASFVSSGPSIIDWLKSENKKVFLDLKFHDIPNTASRAVS